LHYLYKCPADFELIALYCRAGDDDSQAICQVALCVVVVAIAVLFKLLLPANVTNDDSHSSLYFPLFDFGKIAQLPEITPFK